ncbi:hypothetical protein CTEN210_12433 [Chaetoceros tenuissimus]|uniref:Ubiquitin-like protease family profile domain-containing protein n=1 Tax=Chaetoceros tenuissimus TaxID=426638 RepID=A0AAD3D381_9STRA|nr:hypothetical protein CTEN210_12432 [Chaetoceros tenuissimus]GFH55957.1 hypothetical protein CTEN210_12433 [Chaetoceros tenuissimus]
MKHGIKDPTVNLRLPVEQVASNFVAPSSKSTYNGRQVLFIMWLFDTDQSKLNIDSDTLNLWAESDHNDNIEFQTQLTAYNVRMEKWNKQQQSIPVKGRKLKTEPSHPTKTRSRLRKVVKEELNKMQRGSEDSDYRCPVKLVGDGAINYRTIENYMSQKFNPTYVSKSSAVQYLRENSLSTEIPAEYINEGGQVRVQIQQSPEAYNGIRSAIVHMYNQCRVEMPADMKKDLSIFIAGIDRTGANQAQKLGLKIGHGKKPMSFEAYEMIAKHLFQSGDPQDVFAHLFLVLDWSLMKRAENCVNAKINHIYWNNDCLVFEFAKEKGKQKGDCFGPWHVYANPQKPHICPVLAFAKYIASFPEVLEEGHSLFEGSGQYRRYNDRFLHVLAELEAQLSNIGFEKGDLGTHSCRKGVGTMIAAGCTVSPPIVALCVRAGWALGGVKDKYLFRENAGDQYVGRCASGLNQLDKSFAISPPYFDFSKLSYEDAEKRKKEIDIFLNERLPVSCVHAKTKHVLKMLFATLMYHYDTLTTMLHQRNPVRASAFFQNVPIEIRELAATAYPWDRTSDTPVLTGIPPHVLAMAEMEKLKLEVQSLKETLLSGIREELDCRGFYSNEINQHRIEELFENQADAISRSILERINVSEDYIKQSAAENKAEKDALATFIDETIEATDNDSNTFHMETNELESQHMLKKRKFTIGFHHGQLNPLPPNYEFPSMSCASLVRNWFIGDSERNVPPFGTLDSHMVKHIGIYSKKNPEQRLKRPSGAADLSMMKSFMTVVERIAKENKIWKKKNERWNLDSVNKLWLKVGPIIFTKFGIDKSNRPTQDSWKTAYNKMSKADAFKNIRNKKRKKEQTSTMVSSFVSMPKQPITSTLTAATVTQEEDIIEALPQPLQLYVLSENDRKRIRDALYSPGEDLKVIAEINGNKVTKRSIRTLHAGQWLNDEIILFFMFLILQRDYCFHLRDSTRKRIHFFHTHFFTKLFNTPDTPSKEISTTEYNYENVKRWSRGAPQQDIFSLDKLFLPVNVNESHWTLIVVFMQQKVIKYYDSLSGDGRLYCEATLRYLKDEYMTTKGRTLDAEEWEIVGFTNDVPIQPNGYDCGVFVCFFADLISLDRPLNSIRKDEIVSRGRDRIALSILNEVPATFDTATFDNL